jgi:hypothetical protein
MPLSSNVSAITKALDKFKKIFIRRKFNRLKMFAESIQAQSLEH